MINLLPKKYRANDTMAKMSKGLKGFGIIITGVFFVVSIIMVAIIIFNQIKIKDYTSKNSALESSIKSMNKLESQYILLKDRAGVFNKAYRSGIEDNLDDFEAVFLGNDQIFISKIQLTGSKNEVMLQAGDSLTLGDFIKKIIEANLYKKVVLNNFGFSPAGGYTLSLQIN